MSKMVLTSVNICITIIVLDNISNIMRCIILAGKKLFIPSKRYKGDTSVVSARLPNELIKDLDRIAEDTGRNRNEIIMLCLEFAIDNLETDTDGKEG